MKFPGFSHTFPQLQCITGGSPRVNLAIKYCETTLYIYTPQVTSKGDKAWANICDGGHRPMVAEAYIVGQTVVDTWGE
jgi:hypothetical protein